MRKLQTTFVLRKSQAVVARDGSDARRRRREPLLEGIN